MNQAYPVGYEADMERVMEGMSRTILDRLAEGPGDHHSLIPGLTLYRRDHVGQPENCFYRPMVSVILQGRKRSLIGSGEYIYGKGHCLINGVDLPSLNHIIEATPEAPFLVVALDLDQQLIAHLMSEISPLPTDDQEDGRGTAVAPADPHVVAAFARLTELLDRPDEIPILAPMIVREIHYRLLTGLQGRHLLMINTLGTNSNRVLKAISWLRENYASPLEVDDLAKNVNMAAPTFRRHFKSITTLSPIQYQKHLRLYEAQRLMLVENADAASAGYAVGYESLNQFNREYKRLFGEPPLTNVSRLRVERGAMAPRSPAIA